MAKIFDDLRQMLRRIDGRGYPAYKEIRGEYVGNDFTLFIDHVQGGPFAAPSRVRARVPMVQAEFPSETRQNRMLCAIFWSVRPRFKPCLTLSNTSAPKSSATVSTCSMTILAVITSPFALTS